MMSFSEGILVGDLIYQLHKEISNLLELKNIRIHPSIRNRYFAFFMLKQIEKENSGEYIGIIGV